jgi:hypothetical protein
VNNRAFGVELEFSSNGLEEHGVARVLRNAFDRAGYRRWNFMQRMHGDGSELELKTPILRGKEGLDKLKLVMNTLYNHDCYCTEEDGLHVHHDAPEFVDNIDNCIRIVKSWRANRHLIYKFVAPDRTHDYYGDEGAHWACPAWTDEDIEYLETKKMFPSWERNDLNLHALSRHGTIELRLHEGTLDFTEAQAWILFGQNFIERTLKHSMRDSKDVSKLLKKIKVNPDAEKSLLRKAGWNR